ncbi:aldo/keto reductase [Robertmurraya massiliosenegalensis]|uniref:aldo/keto reductase n=1 Tax=Robertmurraya massiliosenegalensis TaxID=1287657 RepID=UPI0002F22A9D|nr:aldo/keto reductase [Robertmurraya massiliosenegalensis]
MVKDLQSTVALHNGVHMPWFGLGVYKVTDQSEIVEVVSAALKHGYRHIDTASFYQNEEGVGKGIRDSGISREDIFVTSKVWNDEQGYEETLEAFDNSLKRLGMDYLDLYLIHWPVARKFKETWKALEKLYREGRVRAIGVSNFHVHHLQDLMKDAEIKPMVNQIEYHPHLTQEEVHAFCKKEGILLEAWSPLKRGILLDEPVLIEIGQKYSKTPAQIILRWDLQTEVITIPKSSNVERLKENADIFDFELTSEEMKQISSLNKNDRVGKNPNDLDQK